MLPFLGALAGSAIAPTLGMSALTASALGSGLGSYLQTGNLEQGIRSGIGAYFGGKVLGNFAGNAMGPSQEELANAAADLKPAPTPKTFMGMTPQQLGTVAGAGIGGMGAIPPKMPEMGRMGPKNLDDVRPYSFGTPYRGMARGPSTVKGYQEGGITSLTAPAQLNDKELISAAIQALQERTPDAEMILAMFIQRFGREELMRLAESVVNGRIADTARRSEGMIRGTGDGMSDMIPATIEGEQDVLLAENEYIVPADVLSGIGNGSSDAGAREMDDMVSRVRQERTGTTRQPDAINPRLLMPA